MLVNNGLYNFLLCNKSVFSTQQKTGFLMLNIPVSDLLGIKEAHLRIDEKFETKKQKSYLSPAHITITTASEKTHIYIDVNNEVASIDNRAEIKKECLADVIARGKKLLDEIIRQRDEHIMISMESLQDVLARCQEQQKNWIETSNSQALKLWNMFLKKMVELSEKIDHITTGECSKNTMWYKSYYEKTFEKLKQIEKNEAQSKNSQKAVIKEQKHEIAAVIKAHPKATKAGGLSLEKILSNIKKNQGVLGKEYHDAHEQLLDYYVRCSADNQEQITKIKKILRQYQQPFDQIYEMCKKGDLTNLEKMQVYFDKQLAKRLLQKYIDNIRKISQIEEKQFVKSLEHLLINHDVDFLFNAAVENCLIFQKHQNNVLGIVYKEYLLTHQHFFLFFMLCSRMPSLGNLDKRVNRTSIFEYFARLPVEFALGYLQLNNPALMISNYKNYFPLEKELQKFSRKKRTMWTRSYETKMPHYRRVMLETLSFLRGCEANLSLEIKDKLLQVIGLYVQKTGVIAALHHLSKSVTASMYASFDAKGNTNYLEMVTWKMRCQLKNKAGCLFSAQNCLKTNNNESGKWLDLVYLTEEDTTRVEIFNLFFNEVVKLAGSQEQSMKDYEYQKTVLSDPRIQEKEKGLFLMLIGICGKASSCLQNAEVLRYQKQGLERYAQDSRLCEDERQQIEMIIGSQVKPSLIG